MKNTNNQTITAKQDTAGVLLKCLANNSAFAILALDSDTLDNATDEIDSDTPVNVTDEMLSNEFDTPFYAVMQAYNDTKRNIAIAELVDCNLDTGLIMPNNVLMFQDSNYIASLKNDIKNALSVMMNIDNTKDVERLITKLKNVGCSHLSIVEFDLPYSGFDVLDTDEKGNQVNVIDFRYNTEMKLVLDFYQHEIAENKAIVKLEYIIQAKDCYEKVYSFVAMDLMQLVAAINV